MPVDRHAPCLVESLESRRLFSVVLGNLNGDPAGDAYNRIWERSPHLWANILRRMRPTSFWFVADDCRPFQGFIQPADGRTFEMIGAADVRTRERFQSDWQNIAPSICASSTKGFPWFLLKVTG